MYTIACRLMLVRYRGEFSHKRAVLSSGDRLGVEEANRDGFCASSRGGYCDD